MKGDLKRSKRLIDGVLRSIKEVPILRLYSSYIEYNFFRFRLTIGLDREYIKVLESKDGKVVIGLDLTGFKVISIEMDNAYSFADRLRNYFIDIGKSNLYFNEYESYLAFPGSNNFKRPVMGDVEKKFLSSEYAKPIKVFMDSVVGSRDFTLLPNTFSGLPFSSILPILIIDFDKGTLNTYSDRGSNVKKCCKVSKFTRGDVLPHPFVSIFYYQRIEPAMDLVGFSIENLAGVNKNNGTLLRMSS